MDFRPQRPPRRAVIECRTAIVRGPVDSTPPVQLGAASTWRCLPMAIAMRPDKPIASKAIENASSRVTSELVWQKLSSGSFAVIGYVTPGGAPRSSGVVYTTVGKRLYTAVAPESWKA